MREAGVLLIVALVCFAIGAVLGALWGRRHPSPAAKLDMIISQAKAKE
jgi:hypothetical protein